MTTVRTVKLKWEYSQNTFVYCHLCSQHQKTQIKKYFWFNEPFNCSFPFNWWKFGICLLFFFFTSFFCVNITYSAPLSHPAESPQSLISGISSQDPLIHFPSSSITARWNNHFSGAEFISVWFSRHTEGSSHKLHMISNKLVTQCSCHIIF